MKKVLVPCDFSFSAKQAYKFALDIASANSGELIVLKVCELPTIYSNGMAGLPYSYIDPVLFEKEVTDDFMIEFQDMKNSFNVPQVSVNFLVEYGKVTERILKVVQECSVDLVVMGTSGTTGIEAFFIGSNTEKMVRFSKVPVFAVHTARNLSDIKNIVFPTSFDFGQNGMVDKIKALQDFFKATLHILYVITPDSNFSDNEAMTSLENYARFYDLQAYTLNIIHQEHEQQGILEFASELDHSIIAMATHGHKGIAHLLMGSIAEKVVNHTHDQVWTYAMDQDK